MIQILGIFLSATAALIGALVLLYLKNLKCLIDKQNARMEVHSTRIEKVAAELALHRRDTSRNFVDKVDWIREVTTQRATMQQLVELVSEMKGSMKVMEQMPQICGNIAREIVKEMK